LVYSYSDATTYFNHVEVGKKNNNHTLEISQVEYPKKLQSRPAGLKNYRPLVAINLPELKQHPTAIKLQAPRLFRRSIFVGWSAQKSLTLTRATL
jgi:hypothetical protein